MPLSLRAASRSKRTPFTCFNPFTEVEYKVDNYYSPAHDLGIFWADSTLKIDWPVEATAAILSAKDQKLPPFDPQAAYFP